MTESWISTFPGYTQALSLTKKFFANIIKTGPVPQHIGFVMDGNRRFARRNKIELKEGHNAGYESMAHTLELCYECGVKSATVFAFSIENFKRSPIEVEWLMELAKSRLLQIVEHGELCEKYGIRLNIVGNIKLLPKDVQEILIEAERITKGNKRAILNVCIPYTSRDDMTHAIKSVVKQVKSDKLSTEDITADTITENLYTAGVPPLELLIRTSGTHRFSDFMLWEASDSGVMVEMIDTLWPDFTPFQLYLILLKFSFNYDRRRLCKKKITL
ncbi:hypothetical protein PACTADRAFT_48007 [Pachysolen tannophilus NRRL Y-2460]|uniref:Alkyl transferase n=1 Tax=Pachysolen tannophilus NRRL Y-2460 TaxID=669874 RepID=A0A1E4U2T9_PACTA|nr:hypothetical protein PACTADRAFT_48007 [Pachysolen tannophilus NRRL Y-2460]